MPDYKAPLREIDFVLHDVLDAGQLAEHEQVRGDDGEAGVGGEHWCSKPNGLLPRRHEGHTKRHEGSDGIRVRTSCPAG